MGEGHLRRKGIQNPILRHGDLTPLPRLPHSPPRVKTALGQRPAAGRRHKYATVKAFIVDLVKKGRIKPGDKIPTEARLTASLGMSRNPVRRALMELGREGVIYTLRGSGSYLKREPTSGVTNLHVVLHARNYGIEKDIVHGIRDAVLSRADRGIHLIFHSPGATTMELVDSLSAIDTAIPGGLIIIPLLSAERSENRRLGAALRRMEQERFRVVQLDYTVPEYEGNCVMSDHEGAAYRMADQLVAAGHRRIAVLYEHPERTSNKLRMKGVQDRLRESGLDLPPSLRLSMAPQAIRNERRRFRELVARSGVTAIFAFQCDLARPLLQALRLEGVRVPEDLSLCTFDEISLVTGRQDDFVTTVVQPLEQIGRLAAELALASRSGSDAPCRQIRLACRIRKGRSIRRLKS